MGKTLTIRIDQAQDDALSARARALGRTRSAVVRDLLDQGLAERPIGGSIGHLKGRLGLAAPKAGWRRRIRERNWR